MMQISDNSKSSFYPDNFQTTWLDCISLNWVTYYSLQAKEHGLKLLLQLGFQFKFQSQNALASLRLDNRRSLMKWDYVDLKESQ